MLFIERERTSSELCNQVVFPESFRQIKMLNYVFCFYSQDRIFHLLSLQLIIIGVYRKYHFLKRKSLIAGEKRELIIEIFLFK